MTTIPREHVWALCGVEFALELRGASKVYAVDIMPQAVALTRRNAKRDGVGSRIEAFTGSLFEPLPGVRSDVIVDVDPIGWAGWR